MALVFEGALWMVGHFAPATRPLLRGAYILVAALFGLSIWRTARGRGADRRHGERRHPT